MSNTSGGVKVLPSFPPNVTLRSVKRLTTTHSRQTGDHDPQRPAACETTTAPGRSALSSPSHNPSLKIGSQARPSYQPPTTLPDSFRNEASSQNDPKSRRQTRMGAGSVFAPHPHFGTDKVKSLNLFNFRNFHRGMKKSLVMFYSTPGPGKYKLTTEFETAADQVQVDGFGFGAVNCLMDSELCSREQVCKTPMLKLYSNGFEVSTIQEPNTFTAHQMEVLMKHTPVLTQPKANVRQQTAKPNPRIIMGTRMLNR